MSPDFSDGMYVVDVWESQEDFDAFVESRLQPAFGAVGGIPEPQDTTFDVHNSYTP
jgi:heme-degrading monooxygenase HmoA